MRTLYAFIICILALVVTFAGYSAISLSVLKSRDTRLSQQPAYSVDVDLQSKPTDIPKLDTVRILAIDGGAMWGLAELQVLQDLERLTNRPIYELFDFVAGSSTGAIVSSLLFAPKGTNKKPISAEDAKEEFERLSKSVFKGSFLRDASTLYGFLAPRFRNDGKLQSAKNTFGDTTFGELLRPTVFPALLQESEGAHLFLNWTNSDHPLLLSSLVPAVTSAEGLFPSIELMGYGGASTTVSDPAVVMNSPGHAAYLTARELYPEASKFVIVTVSSRYHNFIDAQLQLNGGILAWLEPAIYLSRTGQKHNSQLALEAHAKFSSDVSVENFLLSPDLSGTDYLSATQKNISEIQAAAQRYIADNQELLHKVAETLSPQDK